MYAHDDWSQPNAGASAHYYTPHDRWVNWSSAMLPVRKEAEFSTRLEPVFGEPTVGLHWTAIVPA